jgi:hypothetical protein
MAIRANLPKANAGDTCQVDEDCKGRLLLNYTHFQEKQELFEN